MWPYYSSHMRMCTNVLSSNSHIVTPPPPQISIPDTPLDSFLAFLEYLYTDNILYVENCMGVLELANR